MKFMQIKPQKARGKFLEDMWEDPAWSAENKEDGDRRIAQFTPGGVRFTGTRESVSGKGFVEKSSNLMHLSGRTSTGFDPLDGTVLDGEIVAPWAENLPGGSSKHVTAIMGSSPDRAMYLQKERGYLEYRVFDCLWFKGEDIRSALLPDRRDYVYQAIKIWKNEYATQMPAYDSESEKRFAWEHAREGLVFKHEDHTYGDERLWVKLKKEATADVVVMGFKAGKGKNLGSVGSIIFGQYRYRCGKLTLDECGAARGFTDILMAHMQAHPKKYKGKVFRIKHYGREPTGAFRHPQFDGWRDDKNPYDCIWNPEET